MLLLLVYTELTPNLIARHYTQRPQKAPKLSFSNSTFLNLSANKTTVLFSYVSCTFLLHSFFFLNVPLVWCVLAPILCLSRIQLIYWILAPLGEGLCFVHCIPSVWSSAWHFLAGQIIVEWIKEMYALRSCVSHWTTLNSSFYTGEMRVIKDLFLTVSLGSLRRCVWKCNRNYKAQYMCKECIYSCCLILIDLLRSRSNCIFFPSQYLQISQS